jgi:hypothetical protein
MIYCNGIDSERTCSGSISFAAHGFLSARLKPLLPTTNRDAERSAHPLLRTFRRLARINSIHHSMAQIVAVAPIPVQTSRQNGVRSVTMPPVFALVCAARTRCMIGCQTCLAGRSFRCVSRYAPPQFPASASLDSFSRPSPSWSKRLCVLTNLLNRPEPSPSSQIAQNQNSQPVRES